MQQFFSATGKKTQEVIFFIFFFPSNSSKFLFAYSSLLFTVKHVCVLAMFFCVVCKFNQLRA